MLTMRQWRLSKEITQKTMSEKLGVHIGTYQNWEKDPGKISIDHAKKISEVLGVPLDEIIFKAEPGET